MQGQGGHTDAAIITLIDDQRHRITNLAPGEIAFYTHKVLVAGGIDELYYRTLQDSYLDAIIDEGSAACSAKLAPIVIAWDRIAMDKANVLQSNAIAFSIDSIICCAIVCCCKISFDRANNNAALRGGCVSKVYKSAQAGETAAFGASRTRAELRYDMRQTGPDYQRPPGMRSDYRQPDIVFLRNPALGPVPGNFYGIIEVRYPSDRGGRDATDQIEAYQRMAASSGGYVAEIKPDSCGCPPDRPSIAEQIQEILENLRNNLYGKIPEVDRKPSPSWFIPIIILIEILA